MRAFLLRLLLLAPALLAAQAPGLAGRWEGAVHLPGADLALQVLLVEKSGAWTGTITVPQQGLAGVPLARLQVEGNQIEFALAGIPGDPFFRGSLKAGRIEGLLQQSGQAFPFSLARPGTFAAKVEAPAPRDPRDRELTFPGFNGIPLRGSVRAAQGRPWFAVLVAGSGPTDRDWSNPLIPKPSHAGRDFAEWLRTQGISSLRYDKRFLGARDSKLDISLDAQSGDTAAAIAAARGLPAAKGRRLLLIGHSEGTILALLNAKDADALLLLAMPGKPLAAQVLEQVRNQFVAAGAADAVSRPNLDHLAAVLQAIRTGQEPPAPGTDVLPAIAGLGRSLAQPRSAGFFRAMMDLDPWQLAARVVVPFAAAWGDRDVQCWKPAIPAGFHGIVLDLPGANHLLKKEPRAGRDLNPALAMDAYGDDTPQADLGPLAKWLGTLK